MKHQLFLTVMLAAGLYALLSVSSCKNNGRPEKVDTLEFIQRKEVTDSTIDEMGTKCKILSDVLSADSRFIWRFGKIDESATFHFAQVKDSLLIEYFPECWVRYPLKVSKDTIIAYWSREIDTKYDFAVVKFIRESKMRRGTPFLGFTLSNDSTLNVIYLNEKLVKGINATDTTVTFLPMRLSAIDTHSTF